MLKILENKISIIISNSKYTTKVLFKLILLFFVIYSYFNLNMSILNGMFFYLITVSMLDIIIDIFIKKRDEILIYELINNLNKIKSLKEEKIEEILKTITNEIPKEIKRKINSKIELEIKFKDKMNEYIKKEFSFKIPVKDFDLLQKNLNNYFPHFLYILENNYLKNQ